MLTLKFRKPLKRVNSLKINEQINKAIRENIVIKLNLRLIKTLQEKKIKFVFLRT